MALINEIYSGARVNQPTLLTCDINNPNFSNGPIRVCTGFYPRTVTLETGAPAQFIGAGLDVSLPKRDTTGQQNLTIAIDNVMGDVAQAIDEAGATETNIVIRQYVLSDLSAPAETPIRMVVAGVVMEGSQAQITASYQNPIIKAWPRLRYTTTRFPGLSNSS